MKYSIPIVDNLCVRVTRSCNLSCQHCRAPSQSTSLHINTSNFVQFCRELKSLGLERVSISGGEPFLFPELSNVVNSLIGIGLKVGITTNGTLLPLVKRFCSTVENRSDILIKVSIDGDKYIHNRLRGDGVYDLALETLNYLSKISFRIGINTVIINDIKFISSVYNDIKCFDVSQWAMITYENRNIRQNQSEKSRIVDKAKQGVLLAKELGFDGDVLLWDFLSHPNGGLLVDVDGRLILPSPYREDDIIVGLIETCSLDLIVSSIVKRIERDPVAFFLSE